MKKKNGFIAISLIYSFFLIFLMTVLSIMVDYTNNRLLVNRVVSDTKNYLNNLAENDPTRLARKNYNLNEVVSYAGESWKVLKDNGSDVLLVLNRTLTSPELDNIINSLNFNLTHTGTNIKMCYNDLSDFYCYYLNNSSYRVYNWQNSIVRTIINTWFETNGELQNNLTHYALNSMTIEANGVYENSYIRIMSNTEASQVADASTWTYTYSTNSGGVSYTKNGSSNISTITEHSIRPVINVKKN